MGTNRNLKAYVRYDGSGRVVAGSLVLRKNKPKVGNFQEVQGYQCCNDVTLTYTPADAAIIDIDFNLYCNGTLVSTGYLPAESTNITELVALLNATFGVVGTFSVSGEAIQLVVSGDQKTALCPVGTLTFTVTEHVTPTTTTTTTVAPTTTTTTTTGG